MVAAPDEISLEITENDVVYEEDAIRLIHYRKRTEKQHRTPIILVYSIVNRYHIFDIHPRKSWVRNLLDQGFDIYVIDWGIPSKSDKYLGLDDYVNGYLDHCVRFVQQEADVDKISMHGYCLGGTIAATYTALHPENVKNMITTAPVIDGWRDTTVVSNLARNINVDKMFSVVGNMPPEFMYYYFSILKPFEQGVEQYINFFKNIENKNFVDPFMRMQKWISDTPPIPGELFRQLMKNVYQKNLLIQNKMKVGDKVVSLKNITMPTYTQISVSDHMVSPECSMSLHYATKSTDKILRLYPTGHVGMIASSFSQKKILPELGSWLAERS